MKHLFRGVASLFPLAALILFPIQSSVTVPRGAAQATGTPSAGNLVGRLHVDAPGVEVRRVNTDAWVPIRIESLIGVGDGVRTLEQGRATLLFFDGVLTTQMNPSSETVLNAFTGASDAFDLDVGVLSGYTTQATRRSLGDSMHFRVSTPAFTSQLREGALLIRVEANKRSAALTSPGATASANSGDGKDAELSGNHGIRSSPGEPLSEVVPAVSFPTLDSALDGCPSTLTLTGDVSLNVRLGADMSFERVGGLDNKASLQVMGVTANGGWYRIRYAGGLGWIKTDKLPLAPDCAGLRIFSDKYGPEDGSLIKGTN